MDLNSFSINFIAIFIKLSTITAKYKTVLLPRNYSTIIFCYISSSHNIHKVSLYIVIWCLSYKLKFRQIIHYYFFYA